MNRRASAYAWSLGVWLVFLVAAIVTGSLREAVLTPAIGADASHIVGTLAFVCVMLFVMWFFVGKMISRCRAADFYLIGLVWTVLTAAFEIVFFGVVVKTPWEEIIDAYNIFDGRIWLLVLLTTFLGPPIIRAILVKADRSSGC